MVIWEGIGVPLIVLLSIEVMLVEEGIIVSLRV